MTKIIITTVEVRLNGQARHHHVVHVNDRPGSKSLKTWSSAYAARRAAKREYRFVART